MNRTNYGFLNFVNFVSFVVSLICTNHEVHSTGRLTAEKHEKKFYSLTLTS